MMKGNRVTRMSWIAIVLLFGLFLTNSCSGVIGKYGFITVSLPSSSGRYVAENADRGFVIAMQADRAFSMNVYEGDAYSELIDGQASLANLIPGDYIIGVVLTGDDDGSRVNMGFALHAVTVTPGVNEVIIPVGPGIRSLVINGHTIDNPFRSNSLPIRFEHQKMIFSNIGAPETQMWDGDYKVEIVFYDNEEGGVSFDALHSYTKESVGDDPIDLTLDEGLMEYFYLLNADWSGFRASFSYGYGEETPSLNGPQELWFEFEGLQSKDNSEPDNPNPDNPLP
ncbi:MAG: hypothetical protein MI717_08390 [Spirochaetales bacterium]|nr:hypothetical protein [Spirochaetales bacterium]